MPELSVVIPTIGRIDALRRVLDRLARQDSPASTFEVIVAPDANAEQRDRVAALLEGHPSSARIVDVDVPGAAAARNRGWRAAEAPLVLFIGDDMLPVPRLIAEHLDWHRRHPAEEVAVLGHVRWADELRVTPFMRWLERRGILFDFDRIEGPSAGWGRLYTANVSLKRAFVERVDGFDEETFPFLYEDLDLGCRLSEHGLQLLYNPDAATEHLHPTDLDEWRERMATAAAAERRFVQKHPECRPYFFEMFEHAADGERATGRGIALTRWVPRGVPWLGRRVWSSAETAWHQALAESFLAAWHGDSSARAEPSQERAR